MPRSWKRIFLRPDPSDNLHARVVTSRLHNNHSSILCQRIRQRCQNCFNFIDGRCAGTIRLSTDYQIIAITLRTFVRYYCIKCEFLILTIQNDHSGINVQRIAGFRTGPGLPAIMNDIAKISQLTVKVFCCSPF